MSFKLAHERQPLAFRSRLSNWVPGIPLKDAPGA
jgi:hypothetical protein